MNALIWAKLLAGLSLVTIILCYSTNIIIISSKKTIHSILWKGLLYQSNQSFVIHYFKAIEKVQLITLDNFIAVAAEGGGLEGLEPPQLLKRRGRAPPINVPYDVISHIT